MPRRIEASQDVERPAAARPVAARERLGRGSGRGIARRGAAEDRERGDEQRPGGFDRRRRDPLGGDDLEARREIEPAAVPRFGDQRVEHGP